MYNPITLKTCLSNQLLIYCTCITDNLNLFILIYPCMALDTGLYNRGLQFYTFFGISIGITQRMIDIGKKITFYFLQNVRKCTVFSHLHFKISKSALMTQKFFFLKNFNMGIKKTQNFMPISNLLMPAFRNAPNKS